MIGVSHKVAMSVESFSYGYYSDLASLLLVDRDADTTYLKVDRQKGQSYIKFVPVENKEKRKYSLDEGVFEDSILNIAEDINRVFSGNHQVFAKKYQYFLNKKRNFIIVYGRGSIKDIFEKKSKLFFKYASKQEIFLGMKSRIVDLSYKNKYCLQIPTYGRRGLLGAIFIVSLKWDNQDYLSCIEEKMIEALGLFGNQYALSVYQKEGIERKVLIDLYLTDKYIGLGIEQLNNLSNK